MGANGKTGSQGSPAMECSEQTALMRRALESARAALDRNEVPVGAVVALDGAVLGAAHNQPIALNDCTAHAELLALRQACAARGTYRLPGAVLYVTLEPCVMCVGAIILARIARVYFGARDPKAGALGSVYDIGRDGRLNHGIEVYGGILEQECAALMRMFFAHRRALEWNSPAPGNAAGCSPASLRDSSPE